MIDRKRLKYYLNSYINFLCTNFIFFFQYSSVPDNVLYDVNLLKNLDFESLVGVFSPPITATEPGEPWLLVRPLELEDFHKGFVQLLTQLTAVGNINQNEFERK